MIRTIIGGLVAIVDSPPIIGRRTGWGGAGLEASLFIIAKPAEKLGDDWREASTPGLTCVDARR